MNISTTSTLTLSGGQSQTLQISAANTSDLSVLANPPQWQCERCKAVMLSAFHICPDALAMVAVVKL